MIPFPKLDVILPKMSIRHKMSCLTMMLSFSQAVKSPERRLDRLDARASNHSDVPAFHRLLKCAPIPVGHYQDESGISHVQPIAPSNKFVRSISREWAVWVSAEIRFVKAGQSKAPQHCSKRTTTPRHDMPDIGFFAISAAALYASAKLCSPNAFISDCMKSAWMRTISWKFLAWLSCLKYSCVMVIFFSA